MRSFVSLVLASCVLTASCKSLPPAAPPAPPAAPAPVVPLDRKVSWILRLEQQRVLRDATVTATTSAASAARTFSPATRPDLEALALDPDPALRARALMAIGRVGLPAGVATAAAGLNDAEIPVRESAAFALGLIGASDAIAALTAALADESPRVRGRAIEALGLIGRASAAPAIADAASGCAPLLAAIEPDDEEWPKSPEVELCRLSLFALVRVKQFDALARVALDAQGQPVSRWWPVAYALQRINDPRSAPALLALASSPGIYTPAFALKGLGALNDRRALPAALAAAQNAKGDVRLRIAAVRALAQIGGADAVLPVLDLAVAPATPPNLALEAVTALGALSDRRGFDATVDLWTDRWPAMRAAALGAAARMDPEAFLLIVSSLDRDREWSVRAALAGVLATLPAERVRAAIEELADDQDVRVRGAALEALARVGSPDLPRRLFAGLEAADFATRATAARLLGDSKIDGAVPRLVAAYERGSSDATYDARLAALEALAKYGGEPAIGTIRKGLADAEWPVQWRAAELLRTLGQPVDAPAPGPHRLADDVFESAPLLHPPFTPHAFVETARGTIELELDVVHAPLTSRHFVELARAGFFNGLKVHRLVPNFVMQTGDPRGDGAGGPGFTIRDELNPTPYLRGTVGMALAGRDTGGSQFFIALSPQPHLDAKYTVFGKVVRGFDLLDAVQQWDVIQQIKIWDGVTLK